MDIRRVLIIGGNTRHIACSAKRAGYTVYAIDRFGDVDTERCVDGLLTFDHHLSDEELDEYVRKFDVDAIVLGSGFEMREISQGRILGNDPKIACKASDRALLVKKLDQLGIPHPRVFTDEIEYPAIIKPRYGMGGRMCRVIYEGLPPRDFVAQEYLQGTFASVSVLSTGENAVALAVNEQLVGVPWLGTMQPFRYCGNVTPLDTKHNGRMRRIAETLVLELGLIGSNGVDFVVTKDGPLALEVNPRFQGSLDTVELSTGVNLFDGHVKACSGELMKSVQSTCFAVKMVVFAKNKMTIRKNLDVNGIVNVPSIGKEINVEEPIATALGTGATRKDAVHMAMKNVLLIKRAGQV
ncbi:MAG: ATP-grasp domain-containing protein [Methanocellales archaeon]|nr:ATP-grasp domain-containing protein [Methanocellales archaeon]